MLRFLTCFFCCLSMNIMAFEEPQDKLLMLTKGIRIPDTKDKIISVSLVGILQEIKNGNELCWSILDLNATGDLGEGNSIPQLESKISSSKEGLIISWQELNRLANKF